MSALCSETLKILLQVLFSLNFSKATFTESKPSLLTIILGRRMSEYTRRKKTPIPKDMEVLNDIVYIRKC